jgi:mono/diheme cytochrome c family protein
MNDLFVTRIKAGRRFLMSTAATFLALNGCLLYAQESKPTAIAPDYQQVIRPIIVDNCLACHGFDEKTREGGLRLDLRQHAVGGGDSKKAAIVPGKPEESELIRRVTAVGTDDLMPPASHAKSLDEKQIDLLRQWIAAGAEYAEHWAFVPPQQVQLPEIHDETNAPLAHPIDRLVAQQLKGLNRKLSPIEQSNVLCRRLYLDLIGLPPSPDELQAFQRDGLQATAEKLLSSERFGEKWARPWLDGARYSDTNGYEKDLKRDQWAWRDWVIRALNADMPYDQFIVEQIAGDLLPNATQDQFIATGFLRNSMINEEGAIVPEQFRMVEMFDRMDCIGKSVLGLTTQCAQCHSHKFDPLTHDEYYGMFAFLNNTYEAQSWVYTPAQQQAREQVLQKIRDAEQQIRQQRPSWQADSNAWAAQVQQGLPKWQPIVFNDMNSVSGLNHPTQERDLSLLMKGHTSDDVYFIGEPKLENITGLQLEVLNHRDLPFNGPGRGGLGNWTIREVEVLLQKPDGKDWEKQKLVNASADFSQAEQKHEEGKKTSGPASLLIDGSDGTWWQSDRGMGLRNSPSVAVLQFETPLNAPAGTKLKITMKMGEMPGCCRFSLTQSPAPTSPAIDHGAVLAMSRPAEARTAEENSHLFSAWRRTVEEFKPLNDQIAAAWPKLPNAETSVLHAVERPAQDARPTHLMNRGEWDRPLHPIQPQVPAAFHSLPASNEPPRLQFARWLVDRRSPLAARVAVNRVWQSIFGTGLVEASEDFGTRTAVPVYRDLLDWLAVDFMNHGWSHKQLIRQIVTSRVYQQTSRSNAELNELDPENRLLARGPRFRADAEVVRDLAMAIGGIIHHQFGGPGIIPPVPQNVLDYNYVYPSYWTPAAAPQRYRRTVYSFRKRSMPDPAMSTFDAPNGDFACSRRIRSNTPLAALTALNEPIFIESAQALALRVLREGGKDEKSRIDFVYLLCTARLPSDAERSAVMALLDLQRKRIAEGWLNAREIATGKADQLPTLPESATPQDAAAWTIAARAILNLDETLSKN